MTTAVSVHRCLAGPACRRAQHIDDQRHGAATEKPNTLCPACLTHIGSAIRQLPTDWQELRDALGEHAASTGQRVHSTPSPAIPISTRKEALMAAIVEMTDCAAAVVSEALHADQPVTYHGKGFPRHDRRTIAASVAITEPNIVLLAAAPPEPALVWKRPTRCSTHEKLIDAAETAFTYAKPRDIAAAREQLNHAYHAAGMCEDCGGWCNTGQARELIELSGIDITLALVELHNQARAELGHTRLRHRYRFPCPDCGGRIYRNDGESIVYCENNPKHTRTEREYKLVAGQLMTERAYMQIREYYLAESYWRLDRIQALINTMADDPRIDLPGAGTIILEQLTAILTDGAPGKDDKTIPHQTPTERATGTDRKTAIERQVDEDNWAWRNEKPYQKPTPKRRKPTKPVAQPIHTASLTAVIDNDAPAEARPANLCSCNMIHAGDCP